MATGGVFNPGKLSVQHLEQKAANMSFKVDSVLFIVLFCLWEERPISCHTPDFDNKH